MIEMIYASTLRGVIDIAWDIPEDLQHFKKKTIGKNIVMGRKTFESIGRPLPKRKNIVLTRNKGWSHEGVEVYHSRQDIPYKDLMIIGGAEIYKLYETRASRLYWTLITGEYEGDTIYSHVRNEWRVKESDVHPTHIFFTLER